MPEPMSGVKIYGVNTTCTHSIGCLYIYIYIYYVIEILCRIT